MKLGVYNLLFRWSVASAASGIAFLKTWNAYNGYKGSYRILGEIKFEDLVSRNLQGKSALWLLAYAAVEGQSEEFLDAWEQHKERITLDDLKAEYQHDSILTLSIKAAQNGYPETFLALCERFQEDIKTRLKKIYYRDRDPNGVEDIRSIMVHLSSAAAKRKNVEKEFIDVLACERKNVSGEIVIDLPSTAAIGKVKAFIAFWENVGKEFIEPLQREEQNVAGTIVVNLTQAAVNGFPEAFLCFFSSLGKQEKDKVRYQWNHFDLCYENLFAAFNRGYPEPLAAVFKTAFIKGFIARIKEIAPMTTLLTLLNREQGHTDESAFLLLAMIALQGTVEQVRQAQQKLNVSNDRLLYLLSYLVAKESPRPFVDFWLAHSNLFTRDDFFSQPHFPLWLLAKGFARKDGFLPFKLVWEHFKEEINSDDFFRRPREASDEVPPIIWQIALPSISVNVLLVDILSFKVREIPRSELYKRYHYKYSCSEYSLSGLIGKEKTKLILAKNTFYLELKKAPTEAADISALYSLAEAAQLVGDSNVFYDLAQYLQQSTKHNPTKAYRRVPEKSPRYQDACVQAATYELSQAEGSALPSTRTFHLRRTLKFALKVEQADLCREFVGKIASLYLHGEIGTIQPILAKIGIEKDPNWYFEQFDEMAVENVTHKLQRTYLTSPASSNSSAANSPAIHRTLWSYFSNIRL